MAAIDTLKWYEDLIQAGNSELEAKAHIYAVNNALTDLITKDDLHKEITVLESRIDSKFNQIFAELKSIRTFFLIP